MTEKATPRIDELITDATPTGNRWGEDEPTKEEMARRVEFYATRLEHYGYDRRNPKAFKILARYFASYYRGTAQKGLCLIGDTGRGKTMAFKIMNKLFNVRLIHAYDMCEKWQRYDAKERGDFWEWLQGSYVNNAFHGDKYLRIDRLCHDAIIDDLGAEPTMSDYGVKQEIQACIQQKRLNQFELPRGAFTHYASNLAIDGSGPETLLSRYGKRFVSRLKQMCYIVHVDGKDWRIEG